jgi:hypothetical protein
MMWQRKHTASIALGILLIIIGCATTPQARAYQSIATCNATELAAVKAFGVLYQAHKAEDPATWGDRYDKAMAAHASYEKIRDAAVDVAKTNGETTVVLAAVNQALNEVVNLLATFGVK